MTEMAETHVELNQFPVPRVGPRHSTYVVEGGGRIPKIAAFCQKCVIWNFYENYFLPIISPFARFEVK